MVGRDVVLNNGVRMPSVIYGAGGAHTQDNVTGTTIAVALALSASVGFQGVDGANHSAAIAAGAAHGNRSSAQAVLRWVLQLGHTLAAATANPAHMLSDLDVFDFELTDREMSAIGALDVAPDDPTKEMCLYN